MLILNTVVYFFSNQPSSNPLLDSNVTKQRWTINKDLQHSNSDCASPEDSQLNNTQYTIHTGKFLSNITL